MSFYEACIPDYEELLATQSPTMRALGTIAVTADSEQALTFISAFEQPHRGALPPNFMPPSPASNPFSSSERIKALADPRGEARALLGGLPFVGNEDIDWIKQTFDGRRLVIDGDLLVPSERVVSIRSFKNWQTGLNNSYNDVRGYSPDALGLGPGSLNAMITYAYLPRETQPKDLGSQLVVARDADGEYWGVLDCDGSHRAGAQKLRGDSHIQVVKTVLHAEEVMPQIVYGVRERFGSK